MLLTSSKRTMQLSTMKHFQSNVSDSINYFVKQTKLLTLLQLLGICKFLFSDCCAPCDSRPADA